MWGHLGICAGYLGLRTTSEFLGNYMPEKWHNTRGSRYGHRQTKRKIPQKLSLMKRSYWQRLGCWGWRGLSGVIWGFGVSGVAYTSEIFWGIMTDQPIW